MIEVGELLVFPFAKLIWLMLCALYVIKALFDKMCVWNNYMYLDRFTLRFVYNIHKRNLMENKKKFYDLDP